MRFGVSPIQSQARFEPNREFFAPYSELNRAIREIFALIREVRSRPLFGHLPCRQSDRPDRSRTLPRRRTGSRQMLEVACPTGQPCHADVSLEIANLEGKP
jgi:hypothetical protein